MWWWCHRRKTRTEPVHMLLIRTVIHLVPKPPDAFIISLTTPVGPVAFPIFNPLIAAATSFSKMRQHGPSPQDNPLHHPSHSQHLEASPYILHTISIRHNIRDTILHTTHADDITFCDWLLWHTIPARPRGSTSGCTPSLIGSSLNAV